MEVNLLKLEHLFKRYSSNHHHQKDSNNQQIKNNLNLQKDNHQGKGSQYSSSNNSSK